MKLYRECIQFPSLKLSSRLIHIKNMAREVKQETQEAMFGSLEPNCNIPVAILMSFHFFGFWKSPIFESELPNER